MLLAAVGLTVGVGTTEAQALGTGKACVFIEPQGAVVPILDNLGHIGWGFQVAGTSTWIYGSTENPNGSTVIFAPQFNGAWSASGTWNDMLNTFTLQSHYPSHAVNKASTATHPGAPYTQYKCEAVANSNVTKAKAAAQANATSGYLPGTNDCLNAVYNVLHAYNAQNLPSLVVNPGPNAWYNKLSTANWNNPSGKLGATLGVAGGSKALGARVVQWPCNGHPDQEWF